MSIILKYILKNMKEKKLRSLLIIISLTLSVVVLTLCLTLKDNILEKYTEFLMKTVGTTDVLLSKDTPFEIDKIEGISDNYNIAPIVHYIKDKNDVIGMNIVDLQQNKMIKSDRKTNLIDNEVIISKKIADVKNIKVNDTINVLNKELKVVQIVENYGIFADEMEEQPKYLVSIDTANKIMYENSDEYEKAVLDENKTYIMGAYIDVLDDNIELAKDDLKQIDKDFSVVTVKASLADALTQINGLMIIMLVITTLIAFYIINSILKLVLEERISVIGTFRSIGASRKMTNMLLYLENIAYAIISSVIGIVIANMLIRSCNKFIYIIRRYRTNKQCRY
ncbi:MAG: FtsX-like permease family protein [Clostridia bacterium]|nr:FtsX-like permease family protein [Clostridia bacterium]